MLISDKADFKISEVIRNKEGHYTMVKRSILQAHITILYLCIPSNRVSNYVRQKLIELQREIDKSAIIVAVFSIPSSEMDRSRMQKISKDIVKLIIPLVNWI